MNFEPINKLTRDLRTAAETLSQQEARFLVNSYYQIQEYRKAAFSQERALTDGAKPHATFTWLAENMEKLERQIERALDAYSAIHPVGQWSRSVRGIGPVIAAGLLAHIDIERAPTVGHIWSFAGLNPTAEWKKGEKRPWNADLKVLCWKIGESFVKVCNRDDAYYGNVYQVRKEKEQELNERGAFADQAKAKLERFKIGKDTDAYKAYSQGRLPPAHVHARAKRYAVKLFLAHWHHVAYVERFKKDPPAPYPIAVLQHAHFIAPPNFNPVKLSTP